MMERELLLEKKDAQIRELQEQYGQLVQRMLNRGAESGKATEEVARQVNEMRAELIATREALACQKELADRYHRERHECNAEIALLKKYLSEADGVVVSNRKSTASSQVTISPDTETHLCEHNPLDVSYVVLALLIALLASVVTTLRAAIGFADVSDFFNTGSPNQFYYNSNDMGTFYVVLRGVQLVVLCLGFVLAPLCLNRQTLAARNVVRGDGPTSVAGVAAQFAHYWAVFGGLSLCLAGGVVAYVMTNSVFTNYVVSAGLMGAGEVLVIGGVVLMVQSTGLSPSFSLAFVVVVSQLVGPGLTFFAAGAAQRALGPITCRDMYMFTMYVSGLGLVVVAYLSATPYVILPPPAEPGRQFPESYSSAPISDDALIGGDRSMATTAIGAFASQFPLQWSAMRELWRCETQGLVAAGIAGSALGMAGILSQTLLGFVIHRSQTTQSQLGQVLLSPMLASMMYLAGLVGALALQRGVAMWLTVDGTTASLVASPPLLRVCGVASVACLMVGSATICQGVTPVAPCALFSLAIALGCQELLAELFPSQVYRRRSLGSRCTYNKIRPSALYVFTLIFVALLVMCVTNLTVVFVAVKQASWQSGPNYYGRDPKTAGFVMLGTCAIPLIFVVRSMLPWKHTAPALRTRYQSTVEPVYGTVGRA